MTDRHALEYRLAAAWPVESWQEVTVLLAVSGGCDSVALLRAMAALSPGGMGRLAVAHFNHRLRGEQSDGDEAFVVGLCRGLGLPCDVGHARRGLIVAQGSDGVEAAARAARYDFFRQAADRFGARYLATAHTADDQAETVLHRILRGTGIAGLSGMSRARPLSPATTLIRPLLEVRRTELVEYLGHLGQPYRGDSSNDDLRFTRNRIRRQLLPGLAAEYNPGIVDALRRLGSLAGEAQMVIDAMVADLADRCAVQEGPGVLRIDVPALAGQPAYVVRELLVAQWRARGWPMQAMGHAQWDLLAEMVRAATESPLPARRKHVLPGNVTAEVLSGQLRLLGPK
jgi:tRNA(Ile)-lysidine synthase